MDHFISGFLKIWNYNRFHNLPKIEFLYTGINMERAKNHGLIDSTNAYLKRELLLHFHLLAQQLQNIVRPDHLLCKTQEEVVFSI